MKGKHFAKAYWSRARIVSVILSIVLLFGCVSFSSAWLIAKNEPDGPVVNEFTGSHLKIELTPDENQGPYQLIPGKTYELSEEKSPEVVVEGGSVECYLFVVFHEVGTLVNGEPTHLDSFISYNYNAGTNWGVLPGTAGLNGEWKIGEENGVPYKDYIFYAKTPEDPTDPCNYVHSSPEDQPFDIMAKNGSGKAYFSVSNQVTKQMVDPGNLSSNPYVTFTAYSIQTLGFKGENANETEDMEKAWAAVEEAIENNNTTKHVVLK